MILRLKEANVSDILILSARLFQARGAKYLYDRKPQGVVLTCGISSLLSPLSAVVYGDFLAKSLQNRRKRQIWHNVSFGSKEKFRRGATGNNNRGRGSGGCVMWFNLPLHTSVWKRRWKSRRSFSCFISRLKRKNITKKDRLSILITHSAIFDVGNCLFGIRKRKKVWKDQPQTGERHKSQTKGDKWNQASIEVKNVFVRYYQQRRAIFFFDWKSKRFLVSSKWISWSWYISRNAPVSFLFWLWHHLLL